MADLKVKLNRTEVREQLLKSSWIAGICSDYANQIRARCGDGYETDERTGKNRVNASVYAATYKAKKDNVSNNTLLKAMGAVHD